MRFECLESATAPQAPAATARSYGTPTFFPDLYVRVLLKRKNSRDTRRDERIEVTKQEVKRAVSDLATRGIQPSIHGIIELLSKDCCRGEKGGSESPARVAFHISVASGREVGFCCRPI